VIQAPRYLKLFMKGMVLLLSLRMMSGGSVIESMAELRDAGKYMASILDLEFVVLTCIWRPKWEKWSYLIWVASMSSLFLQIKAPLSTNSRLLTWNGWPWDTVLCPMSHPFPFLKYLYSGLWIGRAGSSDSMMACITKRKRMGAMLSPCWTPVSYGSSFCFPPQLY